MEKLHLPYVNLPHEFITLLKSDLSVTNSPAPIFDVIRPNKALYSVLETAFKEFDDGRGVEKVMMALGWANFRERMASIYISKALYGQYPSKTEMELVDDIQEIENRFSHHAVHSYSRLFLLGFYIKLANLQLQRNESTHHPEIQIPKEIGLMLKLSQGRSTRIDWLILILLHMNQALGDKLLLNSLIFGKKLKELYQLMSVDFQELLHQNLLAYGASIQEDDIFLYERV
jgi:hypothetical protein